MADYQNEDLSMGVVWNNQYKTTEKHPDKTGHVILTKPLLRELVEKVKAGKEARIDLAMWNRSGKDGKKDYTRVIAKISKDSDSEEVPF